MIIVTRLLCGACETVHVLISDQTRDGVDEEKGPRDSGSFSSSNFSCAEACGGFQKSRALLGVTIFRIMVYRNLCWAPYLWKPQCCILQRSDLIFLFGVLLDAESQASPL